MEYKKLGDFCNITSSKRIFAEQYVSEGIPFYRSKEIIEKNNNQNISEPLFISKETYETIKEKFGVPKENDILLTSVGTLGIPYIVKNETFYFKDGNLTWLKDFKKELNQKYLYYWLSSKFGYKSLTLRAIGSSQPALTIDILKKYKLFIPPLPTQQKIATILSAYDNLIQNYKKQIEALQTAASELYKEWFVRFRFPGYQTNRFENGIPEEWKIERLTKLVEIKYGKDHSKLDDGNIPVYGSGGIMRYCNKALYDKETVLIPRKGSLNNIMYANRPLWTVDTMFYSIMLRKNLAKYLYYVLSKIDMESFNAGAALPSMTTEILSHFKIIVPDNEILESFDKKIALIFTQIDNLQQQITNLTQQRDLLLPRLMSGKLGVE